MSFELSSSHDGEWVTVALRGEVDLASAPQFRRALHEVIDQGNMRVILDLSNLEFMDSTGLGVLIGCLKRLKEGEGELVLENVRPAVSRVFEVTGLDRIFTIHSEVSG